MKSQAEKKKRTQERQTAARKNSTSIRFSQNDREIIDKKAEAKGMQFSEYVRHAAVHGDEGLSPAKKRDLQNIVNEVYELAKEVAPEKAQDIERKVGKVWTW